MKEGLPIISTNRKRPLVIQKASIGASMVPVEDRADELTHLLTLSETVFD